MKFSVFGLSFCIQKSKASGGVKNDIGLRDVRTLNDSIINYTRSLDCNELSSRIKSISIPDIAELGAGQEILQNEGIVIIPDYIPKDTLVLMEEAVGELASRVADLVRSGDNFFEDDDILFQRGTAKLSGYGSMSSYKKAVIQVREGQDEGMIDMFNVDKFYSNIGLELRPFFDDPGIKSLLGTEYGGLQARNLNMYMNKSISRTRGFHVDSYAKQVKAFVYLTDVDVLDDGPYTYVKRSHIDTSFRRANQKLSKGLPNATETPIVPLENIVPVLAKKGSIIISDQGGSHRGFPQGLGHERVIAVVNYS